MYNTVGIYICGLREITYILCLELRPLVWAINMSVYSMWGSVFMLPPNIFSNDDKRKLSVRRAVKARYGHIS